MLRVGTILSLLSLAVVGCQPQCLIAPSGVWDYTLRLSEIPDAPAGLGEASIPPDPATVDKLDRKPRFISLAEAFAIALEQGTVGSQGIRAAGVSNDDLGIFTGSSVAGTDSIRVFALNPAIAGAAIEGAMGRFDANWFGNMSWTTTDEPQQGFSSFSNGMAARLQTGLAKPLATGGTTGITFTSDYNLLNNPPGGDFGVLNPTYATRLQLGFEQPLLRNFGVATNQLLPSFPGSSLFNLGSRQSLGTGIVVARLRFDQSRAEFERRVNFMLLNVEAAYWNLYGAYIRMYTNDMALRMAYEVWRITNEQSTVGRGLPAQLYGARAQYEQFRATRFEAVGRVLEAERTLRQLLGMPVEDGHQLIPVDAPTVSEHRAEWKSALYDTLTRRPELDLARMEVKAKELQVLTQRNFLRPDLRLQATYTGVGLGSRLDGSATTVDANGERFNNSLAVLASRNFNNWNVGLNWNSPLGYRAEHALMRQAKLELAQSYVFLKEQETKATSALATQYSKLAETYRQIEPRQKQREMVGKQVVDRLDIYGRFGEQKVPLDFLQSSVSQWANALVLEYQAIVDYNIALAAFEFTKGTLMQYDHVSVSEGPLPDCVQVRASEHEYERSTALVLRERALPVRRQLHGLPCLPQGRAPGLPALMENYSLAPPPPVEATTPSPNPESGPSTPAPELLPPPRMAPEPPPALVPDEPPPAAAGPIFGPLAPVPNQVEIQPTPMGHAAMLGPVLTEPPK